MRGKVSAHETYTAGNKHSDPTKKHRASTDVINDLSSRHEVRLPYRERWPRMTR
jgi:hypothetical protein